MYAEYARNNEQTEAEEKLLFTGVNMATVNSGIFDTNNILIHVGQNFLNFAAGTVMWFAFAWLNPTGSGRRSSGRSLDGNSFLGQFSADDFSWLLRKIADTSDIIAGLHDEL